MRRRGRSVDYGDRHVVRSRGDAAMYTEERPLVISEVPAAWRKYANEPWRILFPDLDWSAPERD
jgi:hypothetical protein